MSYYWTTINENRVYYKMMHIDSQLTGTCMESTVNVHFCLKSLGIFVAWVKEFTAEITNMIEDSVKFNLRSGTMI